MIISKVVFLLLVGLRVGYGDVVSKSMVTLQNNRYSGIVIAINPNITEDPSLVDAIEKAWTEASPALFSATRSRAYFGDITILIPSTWSTTAFDEVATRETYNAADVLVANTNPSYGDAPYTVQYGGCGSKGSYIHLTPEYLKNDIMEDSFGPRAKTIVHEWAHYRWGVFDETDTSQPFYNDRDGNVLTSVYDNQSLSYTQCPKDTPICCKEEYETSGECRAGSARCSTDSTTGMFTETCTCFFENNGSSVVDASIMSNQYLQQVVTFCEDSPGSMREHNKNAPNDQNRLCHLRSTWSVISTESADFNGTNGANPSLTNFIPTFTVKKPERNKRYVLVLDVSGSMGTIENSTETRIEIANKAAAYFINTVPVGSLVSIVEFQSIATTIAYLTAVNSDSDRRTLISSLPITAGGGTCISCGISEAINVLEYAGDPAGGYIIVMTDGLGTLDTTVSNEAINKKVIIETLIIYTAANDALVQLTMDTGGSWFFARSDDLLSLIQAYGEFADPHDGDIANKNLEVYSETVKLTTSHSYHSSTIIIDPTIGESTTFTYTWSYGSESLEVTLSPPSGSCSIYSPSTTVSGTSSQTCADISIDTSNKMMVIKIKGTAQVGMWQSYVANPIGNDQTVSTIVTSKASDEGDPIMAESSVEARNGMPIVYAKVTQGMNPVLGANVTAILSVQGGSDVIVSLYDAGADPDIRRNDGIYSRYVTGITSARYSVKVQVESQYGGFGGTVIRGAFSRATYNPGYYLPNGTVVENPNGATFLPEGTAFGVTAQDLGNFTRQASAGAFDYLATSVGDALPPSRVLDLSVRQNDFNNVSKGIVLSFTAPGDDYDSGTATRYEIRYTFGSPQDLVNNFVGMNLVFSSDVILGDLTNPQSAGVSESFIVVTPTPGSAAATSISIGFALKTYDEVNNEAQISNVANLRYYIQPPTFAVKAVTTGSPQSTFSSTDSPDTTIFSTTDSQTITQSTSSATTVNPSVTTVNPSVTTVNPSVTASNPSPTTISNPSPTTISSSSVTILTIFSTTDSQTITQSTSSATTVNPSVTTVNPSVTTVNPSVTASNPSPTTISNPSPTTISSSSVTTGYPTTAQPTSTASSSSAQSTNSPSTFRSTTATTTSLSTTAQPDTTTASNTNITSVETITTTVRTSTVTKAITTTSSCKDCKNYVLWLWVTLPAIIFREFHR